MGCAKLSTHTRHGTIPYILGVGVSAFVQYENHVRVGLSRAKLYDSGTVQLSVAETLVSPDCSTKGNIMSTLSLTSLAQACGNSVGNMNKALATAEAFKTEANNNILALHKAKAKIGTYKKDGTGCGLATAFVDGCMASGLTQSTAQKTYLPTFKKAVESGKAVTDWNSQRAKKGGTSKSAKGKKEFADKLATVYRDADFEGFMDDLQTSYENAEFDTLHEGIKSFLEASGIKLKD